jgi:hypothetical protein
MVFEFEGKLGARLTTERMPVQKKNVVESEESWSVVGVYVEEGCWAFQICS